MALFELFMLFPIVRNIIISHSLECEMGQFHSRGLHFQSESRLATFLKQENVNPRVELSDLTLFGKNSV